MVAKIGSTMPPAMTVDHPAMVGRPMKNCSATTTVEDGAYDLKIKKNERV